MPPTATVRHALSLLDVAEAQNRYARDAFHFIQRGLAYTAEMTYFPVESPNTNRHVDGRQLCLGLREFAFRQWGPLSPVVLERWGICSTLDFGFIVFQLIEAGVFHRQKSDTLND
ncbi:MAG TPA: hypothetical protein PK402_11450, partial [Tepidisphaeraceae bacterium]|nr:hypothetical protein [Tepidisphaeraceae bacterium]